ncbi:MAG: alanine--tRNA ligase-related protein, partial [Tepidisphaeraceae bacterium]
DVGRSRRHHTFFEMLGNWSFGDYFKRGAIEMAWELLTKVWKLDPTRLHVSCYEGDEKNGVPRDTEAADLWKRIAGMSEDHIHYFGADNFWLMGDTGPCGPCTEIYIDRTPDKSGGKQVNGDDPRVMEIWNLVFIQFNRDATGKLTPLPAKHVDTGMGFERICQVLQDKQDNYGIDLWTPFFDRISEISNLKYTGKFPPTNAPAPQLEAADEQLRHDIAFRVVADHVRCLTFALTDGAVPSNEGRGYVLRRILRRAVRFGRQTLGLTEPFMHQLVPVVVDSMGAAFPELKRNPNYVIESIKDEELSFGKTLDRGIELFEEAAVRAGERNRGATLFGQAVQRPRVQSPYNTIGGPGNPQLNSVQPMISGVDAFTLHDTYGFPIDLTRIMAEERGMAIDIDGFNRLMEEARERSRNVEGQSNVKTTLLELQQRQDLPATEFVGYDHTAVDVKTTCRVFDLRGEIIVVTGVTPFYAESGGQVGDKGFIEFTNGSRFHVEDTQKTGATVFHRGHVTAGEPIQGDSVELHMVVRSETRQRTMANHTGTHLANWALRQTLGDGVQQKGSLVDPEKLRFDFSHPKSLSDEEIAGVEKLVGDAIAKNLPVYAQEAPQDQALKINGLRAVFGEKYPSIVRVVSIGTPVKDLLANPGNSKWREFSIEFCGGTHLASSDQVGRFAITAEESVSKGIRRIVALTGEAATVVESAAAKLDGLIARKISDAELPAAIAELQAAVAAPLPLRAKRRAQAAIVELQARQRAFEKSSRAESTGGGVDAVKVAADMLAEAGPIAGGKLIVGQIPGATDEQLRSAIDSLRKKSPTHAILLAAGVDQKVTFVAAVSDDVIAKGLKAGDWVKQVAAITGGGGGGRPQMAQGSGKDPSKIPAALDLARTLAAKFA